MKICIMGNARSAHTPRWAEAYTARGHDVHVLSIRSTDIRGVAVHPVHIGRPNSGFAPIVFLSYLRLLLSARRRLRRMGPDVVHAHYTVTHGVIAAASGFHPVVLSAWGTDVVPPRGRARGAVLRALNRYALRRADRITSTSAFMVPIIEQLIGRGATVDRVAFGVELDVFTPASSAEGGTFTVGFVKHLKRKYGPTDLIEAAGKIAGTVPDLQVILAGEGDQREPLRQRAAELGISDRVEFLGRVPHDAVPALMRSFDVFVNPSITMESFGVAILEASATALPVVATNVGGVPEVAEDGVTALMVAPGRPDEIAAALRRLAADPDLRTRLGTAGRSLVAARYQWSDNVTAMLDVLAAAAGTSQ